MAFLRIFSTSSLQLSGKAENRLQNARNLITKTKLDKSKVIPLIAFTCLELWLYYPNHSEKSFPLKMFVKKSKIIYVLKNVTQTVCE